MELPGFLHECAEKICLKRHVHVSSALQSWKNVPKNEMCVCQLGCTLWCILASVCSYDSALIDRSATTSPFMLLPRCFYTRISLA